MTATNETILNRAMQNDSRHMKILNFIIAYQNQHKCPPSIREIGDGANISSTSVVNYYLDQLESFGLAAQDREPGARVAKARSWFVTEQGHNAAQYQVSICPHCGVTSLVKGE